MLRVFKWGLSLILNKSLVAALLFIFHLFFPSFVHVVSVLLLSGGCFLFLQDHF